MTLRTLYICLFSLSFHRRHFTNITILSILNTLILIWTVLLFSPSMAKPKLLRFSPISIELQNVLTRINIIFFFNYMCNDSCITWKKLLFYDLVVQLLFTTFWLLSFVLSAPRLILQNINSLTFSDLYRFERVDIHVLRRVFL